VEIYGTKEIQLQLSPLISASVLQFHTALLQCCTNSRSVVKSDCCKLFVDCDTKTSPQPFFATCDVAHIRFQIAAVKILGKNCDGFCHAYGGISASIDTEQEYGMVYKMIQKTNKELHIRGNYVIGLERRSKLYNKGKV
jgi:hypothetical protein